MSDSLGGGEGDWLLTFADVQVHNERAQRISQCGHGVDFGGDAGWVAVLCFASAKDGDRCEVKRIGLTTSDIFSTSPSTTALQNFSSSSLRSNIYDCAKRDHSASS